MDLSLLEIQNYGSEMLYEVASLCEKENIRWYMAYGSCLGAVRHGGPIPWDYDIDIYVPECELARFIEVMEKQLPVKYWVDYRAGCSDDRAFPRIGLRGYETELLHIDVFRLGGLPQNIFLYKPFVWWSRMLFVMWKSRTLDISFYYPDLKRRIVSNTVKKISSIIPLKSILKAIDRQASRIPFDQAKIVASPITTMARDKMIDRHIFDESILVDYAWFKVRIPKNYEKYLAIQFGDWRQFPPLEEREKEMRQLYQVREIK